MASICDSIANTFMFAPGPLQGPTVNAQTVALPSLISAKAACGRQALHSSCGIVQTNNDAEAAAPLVASGRLVSAEACNEVPKG